MKYDHIYKELGYKDGVKQIMYNDNLYKQLPINEKLEFNLYHFSKRKTDIVKDMMSDITKMRREMSVENKDKINNLSELMRYLDKDFIPDIKEKFNVLVSNGNEEKAMTFLYVMTKIYERGNWHPLSKEDIYDGITKLS